MVTFRKTWQVASPSRGGEIRGRAVDQSGDGVQGALVRLGPYSAITDEAGGYIVRASSRTGSSTLALDKAKLPAAYASDEQPRPLNVTRTSRETVDLQVIPPNAIRGRVYLDRNHNGFWDEDEGIPNAIISVNGSVTATTATGTYAFYNQPPGHYTVRLDVSRLAKGLAPASPAELDVEFDASDHPQVGVDFKVEKKDMPIIMREILPPVSGPRLAALAIAMSIVAAVSVAAQEMVSISVPMAVSFQVTDVSRSTSWQSSGGHHQLFQRHARSGPGPPRERPGGCRGLYTAERRAGIPASKVSWNNLGASGGVGLNGTLGSSFFVLVFQSDPGITSGRCRPGMDAGGSRRRDTMPALTS